MTPPFPFSLLRAQRRELLLLLAVMLAQSAAALVVPLLAGRLAGLFLGPAGPAEGVLAGPGPLDIAIIALLTLSALMQATAALIEARVHESLLADLRQRLFDHLLALPLPWHQAQSRGDTMAILTVDVERLSGFVTGTLVPFIPTCLTALGATVLMLRIDPALSLLVPILVPAFYILLRLIGRRLRGLGQRLQEADAAMTAAVEEMLDLVPALKSFAVEPTESRNFAATVARLRDLSLREAGVHALLDPATRLVASAAAVMLIVMAGRNLQTGTMTPAEAVAFLMYVALLVQPVSALAVVWGRVQTARGTLARLGAVLAEPAERAAAGPPLPRPSGDVRFDGVTFAYPERGAAVRAIDLHIRPGEIVALTGPNGAGKTTVIGLLLGFYRPETGRILIDGQDIAMLPPDHLRAAIGHVPQTRHMRNASVANNIAFGRADLSPKAIEDAARIAQAHDFITALPRGYDTMIGDKGVRLSGGQQQRIALARALVGDPPILVLDEATSMYDIEGEAAFIAECGAALAGRTVILITHRPASLALAGRVLRLDEGRIIAEETRP